MGKRESKSKLRFRVCVWGGVCALDINRKVKDKICVESVWGKPLVMVE